MKRSPITYTWSGDFAIAYQVVGNGPIDLVYVPPWASNLDGNWMWSHHARFLNRLASFSRLILYDPRGWGCSDRVAPGQTIELEEHVVDLIAVLDAANARQPAMFVSTDMGAIGLLAGVHTGEVEHAVDGLRGIAVHIAARVMSLAGPSELLVSSTVRELSTGSGLAFEDAGERELKGVPDRWHLYRVVQ